jgi:two-component system response regulator HupR/HoxA
MINWDELKHMHVIRKLEGIFGQWFSTDIFFADERGQIRNFDVLDKKREFKNPVAAVLFQREKGRELLAESTEKAVEQLMASGQASVVIPGPCGLESVFVTRIMADGEFLGIVYAYCHSTPQVSEGTRQEFRSKAQAWGYDVEALEHALSRLKPLADSDRKYYQELVDLLSQEIVTLHTEISKREEKIHALNHELGNRYSYHSMIGKSKPMQDLYSILEKIKNSDSTVLIQGENGTGKELIARAVHFNSPRKDAQFIPVNCSAFNENLLDSELFGHVKGSFTGAVRDKKGVFETADKGTLFLDEIGDMSPTMQVKLLRVIQEGTLTPVGGTEARRVDVRVVAATNRDLKEMIELGTFREDLYYRINVINIVVPPLRERREDIPVLVDSFVARGCKEKNLPVKQFAKRTMEKIFDYPWPGNVRELENEVERLLVLSGDEVRVNVDLLSPRIRDFGDQQKVQGVRIAGKLKDALEELERTMIKEGLKRNNWNKTRLAKELGISRAGLIMKVEKYGLDKRKIARAAAAAAAAGHARHDEDPDQGEVA